MLFFFYLFKFNQNQEKYLYILSIKKLNYQDFKKSPFEECTSSKELPILSSHDAIKHQYTFQGLPEAFMTTFKDFCQMTESHVQAQIIRALVISKKSFGY